MREKVQGALCVNQKAKISHFPRLKSKIVGRGMTPNSAAVPAPRQRVDSEEDIPGRHRRGRGGGGHQLPPEPAGQCPATAQDQGQ